MMGRGFRLAAAVLAVTVSPGLCAAGLDWGGDLRVRFTTLDDIPTQIPTLALDQGFNRDRVRLWLDYMPNDDVTLRARIINEWRWYDQGRDQAPDYWNPMTEVLPDELYADVRNLADGKLGFKVGRQTVKYGTGKIFVDGTHLDGSRTDFLDGAKMSVNLGQHKIDLLAFYAAKQPALAINAQDRDLVGHNSKLFGLYGQSSESEQFPYEYYYAYKKEDDSPTSGGDDADATFHTFGGRVSPKFGNGFGGNLEFAYQTGDHELEDIEGTLLDLTLSYSPEVWGSLKPKFSAGYYYLSGDDADTNKNESWHPVYSYIPQLGEMQGYSYVGSQYGPFGWSNQSSPWVGLDLKPFTDAHLLLRYFKLRADVSDGPGSGSDRGDSFWALLLYKITPNLSGHLWAEYINTGNYYAPDADDGLFARAHFEYKF